MRLAPLLLAPFLLAGACSSTPPAKPADAPAEEGRRSARGPAGPTIEAEVGALDEDKVKETFAKAKPGILDCYQQGTGRISFLEGAMKVLLRIGGDGRVRYGVPLSSTFGDVKLERCVIAQLEAQAWPRPQGGKEGETTQAFDIGTEERAAVAWGPAELGGRLATLRGKLGACKRGSGTASLSVTIYIGTDGKPMAAGAAVTDEPGIGAIDCAVQAAMGLVYPKPGSWPAKVTVQAP